MSIQNFLEVKDCVIINSSCLSRVLSGSRSMLINPLLVRGVVNRFVYLVSGTLCYGVITLVNPSKLNLKEFDSLFEFHNISKENLSKWWPSKEVLFGYDINVIKLFDSPREIIHSLKDNKLLQHFEFKDNVEVPVLDFSDSDVNVLKSMLDSLEDYSCTSPGVSKKEVDALRKKYNLMSDRSDLDFGEIDIDYAELKFTYHEFDNIFEAVEHMFVNDSSFIVEQDQSGVTCTLVKQGDLCKLYYTNKLDITSYFPDLMKQVRLLSSSDFALDVRLCIPDKSKKAIDIIIKSQKKFSSDVFLHVIDCLYFGSDVRNLPYVNRKKHLNSLSYTNNIIESPYFVVENQEQLKESYNIINMLSDEVIVTSNNKSDAYLVSEDLSSSSISNHSYFSKQSGPMFYFLGFLSCDGHVDVDTNRVEIHIAKDDSEIIKNFQKALGDNRDITNGFLKFKSKELVKDLAKYDLTKLKPLRRTFNKIPSSYKWDFIRGCFDADGTILKEKLQFDSGNRPMVRWLYDQFKKIGGDDVKYYNYDSTSKCTVYKNSVNEIHSKIYSGGRPYLSRKKNYLSGKNSVEHSSSDVDSVKETSPESIPLSPRRRVLSPGVMFSVEDIIRFDKIGDNFKIYLIKSYNAFVVKTTNNFGNGVDEVMEYYRFNTIEKATSVYEEIYNGF